ncbi:MAG TPA: YggT family protein [Usitatibacter sp.]|nr:YggT family protein [Usitatibacter sp.]
MLSQALAFVLDALASLFILAALVRFWMQAFRAPARNPIAYFTMAVTDWAVRPLRRVIPGLAKLDWASLVVAWIFEFALQFLLVAIMRGLWADNAGALSVLLFASFVELLRLSIYIFMGAVVLGAVLSWVNPYHPVAPFFAALANPFMKPVRRVIPPIGGVDISPVFVLIFFQLLLILPIAWLGAESRAMLDRALL